MKTIQNILICVAVAMVSLLGSCKSELDSDSGLAPGTVQVQLVVPHAPQSRNSTWRANTPGTADEDYVGKVQLIFWNTTKGILERYIAIDPAHPIIDTNTVWNPATATLTMADANLTDKYRIYVMANGTGTELAAATTEAEINQAFAQHTGAIINTSQTPLPMSGISVEGNLASGTLVPLRRMVAKVMVRVTLDGNFVASHPNYLWGSLSGSQTSLQLINVPHKTFVLPRTTVEIPSDGLVNDNASNLPVVESGVGAAMSWQTTAYVYENPTADAATSMKIALNLPYKDGSATTVTENLYTVEINHAAATSRVERNYIYQVNIVVKGLGYKPKPVTVTTTVLPWNVVDKPSDVAGGYVNIYRAAYWDGVTEIELSNKSNIPENADGKVRIYCKTNVGGLYMIVRDYSTIIINTKSTLTSTVTEDTELYFEVDISPIDYLDHEYTVSIHHAIYASELIDPIKFSFTQYGGFIPRELLRNVDFTDIPSDRRPNGNNTEWTTESALPIRGLQLAKRGNIRPEKDEIATQKEQMKIWGINKLIKNTKWTLGTGMANTDNIINMGNSNYEAAIECRKLGPEWYLPSFAELYVIYQNQKRFGTSYAFKVGYPVVISSSEKFDNGVYIVPFVPVESLKSYDFGTYKSYESAFRCVRNI